MTLDVGIVGAGFAGTAAALFLARDGHRVTLYEEAETPRAIGAGILLQPTGLSVLAQLGLYAEVVARGSVVRDLVCVRPGGWRVLDLKYADFVPDWFGLGMHRGALFELLFEAVQRESVRVECACSVRSFRRTASRIVAQRADGGDLGDHDLLVVADGARSELRFQVEPNSSRRYPWGALWFIGRDEDRRFDRRLFQVADSTTTLVGFLPSGLGPKSGEGAPLVSLFWSLPADAAEQRHALDLAAFKARVRELEPRSAPLLDQIESVDQLLPAVYHDVVMRRWSRDRIVFIGDAAHATSPQLGQGCNLALEDARVLAESLRGESVANALVRFERMRRRHVAYYQFASRALTPFFQSNRRWLAPARDVALGVMCRTPGIRRLLVSTLCGVRRGFVRRSLALQPIPDARALLPRRRP